MFYLLSIYLLHRPRSVWLASPLYSGRGETLRSALTLHVKYLAYPSLSQAEPGNKLPVHRLATMATKLAKHHSSANTSSLFSFINCMTRL